MDVWTRTCQDCGNKQTDKEQIYGIEPSDSYKFRKCKKCKSESLDYGSMHHTCDKDCNKCIDCKECIHNCMCY